MSAIIEDLKLKTKVIGGLDKIIIKIVNVHGIAKAQQWIYSFLTNFVKKHLFLSST